MISMIEKFESRWIFFICGLTIIIQSVIGERFFDDAYITFRYARNMAEGIGFVYNAGEKILGTTTPLFTLILAIIGKSSAPMLIPHISFLISLLSDAISIWLIFRIARIIFIDSKYAYGIAILFAFQALRLNIAVGGMETSFFILFLLLIYYFFYVKNNYLLTTILSAFSILIRPDAILAIIPLYILWFFRDWRRFLKYNLITLLILIAWWGWSSFYFGNPIPNSILAKGISYSYMPAGHAAWFLLSFFSTGSMGPIESIPILTIGSIGFFVLCILGFIEFFQNNRRFLPIIIFPILYFFIFCLRNPSMYFPWYFLPLIPGILFLFAGAFKNLVNHFNFSAIKYGIVFIFILWIIPQIFTYIYPTFPISRIREFQFHDACIAAENYIKPGDTILTADIGVIGWCFPQAYIIDPVGLVTPDAIPYTKKKFPGIFLSPELIQKYRPEWIMSLDNYFGYLKFDSHFLKTYKVFWVQKSLPGKTIQPYWIFTGTTE